MSKKYEMTEITKHIIGRDGSIVTLHQIRHLKSGKLGGFIESEKNLSQEGECFIVDNVLVYGNACVFDNAFVTGNTVIYGNAQVFGDARINGSYPANICGNAKIYGNALLSGDCVICDDARVCDKAQVLNTLIEGSSMVFGDTTIYNSYIFQNARINGATINRSTIDGSVKVTESAEIIKSFINNYVKIFGGKIHNSEISGESIVTNSYVFNSTLEKKVDLLDSTIKRTTIKSTFYGDNIKMEDCDIYINADIKHVDMMSKVVANGDSIHASSPFDSPFIGISCGSPKGSVKISNCNIKNFSGSHIYSDLDKAVEIKDCEISDCDIKFPKEGNPQNKPIVIEGNFIEGKIQFDKNTSLPSKDFELLSISDVEKLAQSQSQSNNTKKNNKEKENGHEI